MPGRHRPSVGSRSTAVLACFDLDGVLVDSEAVKLGAFRDAVRQILEPTDELLTTIDAYNRLHRGVPRREKFGVATALALGTEDAAVIQALLDAYASLLSTRLPQTRTMPGAIEFTRAWPGDRALVTSAPRAEARSHLHRLGFPPFHHVFDADTPKAAALRLLARGGRLPVVFFGDAQADADAARSAAVAFVAVGSGITDTDGVAVVARVATLADLLGKERSLAHAVCSGKSSGAADGQSETP